MSKFDRNWIKDGWEKLCTNKQTDRQPTDTTEIMVTWPWTKNEIFRGYDRPITGVEFSIFPLIFEWAFQQRSATALSVINTVARV